MKSFILVLFLSKSLFAGLTAPSASVSTIEHNGNLQIQRSIINYTGAGVSVADIDGKTTVTVVGAASTNYNATMSGTQTTSSTTMADVTTLVTPVIPVGTYKWEVMGAYQTAATTTGIGMRIVAGSATMSVVRGQWFFRQAANGVASNFQIAQLDQTLVGASASVVAANTNYPLIGLGYFTLTVAGTVKIQVKSEVADSNAILQAGTFLSVTGL